MNVNMNMIIIVVTVVGLLALMQVVREDHDYFKNRETTLLASLMDEIIHWCNVYYIAEIPRIQQELFVLDNIKRSESYQKISLNDDELIEYISLEFEKLNEFYGMT